MNSLEAISTARAVKLAATSRFSITTAP
jgi:hypothetical protein